MAPDEIINFHTYHTIHIYTVLLSETHQTFSLCLFSCFFESTEAEDGRPPEKEIRNTQLDKRSSNKSLKTGYIEFA